MFWRSSPSPRRPPGFIEPCLPTLGHSVPTGPQWVYEIKHDGFRFICRREGEAVRVFSRRGNDFTDRVPLIAEALAKLRGAFGLVGRLTRVGSNIAQHGWPRRLLLPVRPHVNVTPK